jgi:hypothetical protein
MACSWRAQPWQRETSPRSSPEPELIARTLRTFVRAAFLTLTVRPNACSSPGEAIPRAAGRGAGVSRGSGRAMVERMTDLPDGVLGLRLGGRIERSDYERVLEPELRAAVQSGRVRG